MFHSRSAARCAAIAGIALALAACDIEDLVGADGGMQPDPGADASSPDPDQSDVGHADAGTDPDPDPDPRADAGVPDEPGPRTVLIGHTFSEDPETPLTELRTLRLDVDGTLEDVGTRLDIGTPPSRIAFHPSGAFAFVLTTDQTGADFCVSVGVESPDDIWVIGSVELPSADWMDLRWSPDGATAFAVGHNSTEDGGVAVLEVDDGHPIFRGDAFLPMRLSSSIALIPHDPVRALLLGGQAVFDPVDVDDIRLLEWVGDGWLEIDAFDIYGDFVNADRIAVSPDGTEALIPNNSVISDEGAQVAVLAIDGDEVSEIARLTDMPDAREALYAPDGRTALITLAEPGRVVVLTDEGGTLTEVERIGGIGLASQIAMVEEGPLSGWLLLPSVDSDGGGNVAVMRIDGPGQVTDLGQTELGRGPTNIPTSIGLQP